MSTSTPISSPSFVRYHEKMPEPQTPRQFRLYDIIRLSHQIYSLKADMLKRANTTLAVVESEPVDEKTRYSYESKLHCAIRWAEYCMSSLQLVKLVFLSASQSYNNHSGCYGGMDALNAPNRDGQILVVATKLHWQSPCFSEDHQLLRDLYNDACRLILLPEEVGFPVGELKPSTAPLVDISNILE
jgi:hypothetical protein